MEDLNILKKILVKIENCFVNLLSYFYKAGKILPLSPKGGSIVMLRI